MYVLQMATGMVLCTFLSAPLMFVSAKMMTVVVNSELDYKSMLLGTSFDLSLISTVCNVSTIHPAFNTLCLVLVGSRN